MSTTATPDSAPADPAAAAPQAPILRAESVRVQLGDNLVLPGASLEVERGEVHLLIGPNGAGKTTFANAITGHVPVSDGTIELKGRPLTGSVWQRTRAGIGRKFQVPRVFERLTAGDNLAVAARGRTVTPPADLPAGADVDVLSHGQRQRLELQMALVQEPTLVVLDEPTAGMTRAERDELAALLRASAGTQTFLVVEHDMDFVRAVADRVSFMRSGEVIATGTFDEIAAHPEVLAAYLGDRTPVDRRAAAQRTASTHGELIVRGLTVRHGRLESVRDVDLTLEPGTSLGLIGRNGAGKTTLLAGLTGSLPTTGEITLDGTRVASLPDWRRAQLGLAIVPQGKQLFADLTVAENLRLATLGAPGPGDEFDIHALFPAIEPLLGRRAGLLSGGEQQQVAIARALLRRPRVLLLDEPTEGISPIVVAEITRVLAQLIDGGLSVVLADQHRALIEALCDRFLVLRSGEIAAGGDVHSDAFDHYDRRL